MTHDPGGAPLSKRRRRLPHWERSGSTYFLTWRCVAGTTLSPAERDLVLENLLHWDRARYRLYGATVMPDHVHVLLRPTPVDGGDDATALSAITHTAKGYTAKAIGKVRGGGGRVWQDGSFDRLVRDWDEVVALLEYIRGNAVARGLVVRPEEYPWLVLRL